MLKNITLTDVLKISGLIVVFLLWVFVAPTTAFFWSVFLLWATWRLDARIIGAVALAFLVTIPALLYIGQDIRAEQLAVYVYFLLAITVVLEIIEMMRTRYESAPEPMTQQQVRAGYIPKPRSVSGVVVSKSEGIARQVRHINRKQIFYDIIPPHAQRRAV